MSLVGIGGCADVGCFPPSISLSTSFVGLLLQLEKEVLKCMHDFLDQLVIVETKSNIPILG